MSHKKVLILGVNGFIGSRLAEQVLATQDWKIFGFDITDSNLQQCLGNERFHFHQGDINESDAWIEEHIKQCDVVLPLVAIANPATYVSDPVRVFELDFEANLKVIKWCLKHNKRVVFPSTSEVYGMSTDSYFDEENTNFVTGPTHKERWIYSCSKQLLDRAIFAYGNHKGLRFTLFRPFNWIGPNLDKVHEKDSTNSRVLSKFLGNVVHERNFDLIDGGKQRRSFTYIDDGIDALMRIIENKDNCAEGQIFNIGNPDNDITIRELAESVIELSKQYPSYSERANAVKIIDIDGEKYYGKGYQDVPARVPSIKRAKELLGWEPKFDMNAALKNTVEFYLG